MRSRKIHDYVCSPRSCPIRRLCRISFSTALIPFLVRSTQQVGFNFILELALQPCTEAYLKIDQLRAAVVVLVSRGLRR